MMKTALALTFATLATSAMAQNAETVGDWTIEARAQPGEKINPSCILRSPKKDGEPQLQLTNPLVLKDQETTSGNASVTIYIPTRDTRERISLPDTVFAVEGRGGKTWTVQANLIPITGGFAISAVIDPEVANLMKPVAQGDKFSVSYSNGTEGRQTFSVELSGSGKAIAAYKACLSKVKIQS